MEHDEARRSALIQAAIEQVYADADESPPQLGSASRIVPLDRLVLEQSLPYRERAGLTRGTAAEFLTDQLRQRVELSGAAAEQLSGYLHATPQRGFMLVNRDDSIARRRFTVAHELGHYVLHALPILEAGATIFSETQAGTGEPDTEEYLGDVRVDGVPADDPVEMAARTRIWEIEANQFAAELLMPEALCRGLVDQYMPKFSDRREVLAKRLASELLVSQQAIKIRLEALGLGRELSDLRGAAT